MDDETRLVLVKAAIAEKFAPAINFKAPYAKVMLDEAAKAAIKAALPKSPGISHPPDPFVGEKDPPQ